jgi:hypothetical protein
MYMKVLALCNQRLHNKCIDHIPSYLQGKVGRGTYHRMIQSITDRSITGGIQSDRSQLEYCLTYRTRGDALSCYYDQSRSIVRASLILGCDVEYSISDYEFSHCLHYFITDILEELADDPSILHRDVKFFYDISVICLI